jgi:hypothetical protein
MKVAEDRPIGQREIAIEIYEMDPGGAETTPLPDWLTRRQ